MAPHPALNGSVHIALPVVTNHNGPFRTRTGQREAFRKAFRMRLLEAQCIAREHPVKNGSSPLRLTLMCCTSSNPLVKMNIRCPRAFNARHTSMAPSNRAVR